MPAALTQGRRKLAGGRRDLYAEVTARITAALERGTVPWRRPWHAQGIRNAATNRPYRGINLLLLGLVAVERGYDDPRWLTYRQAAQIGGHVRRGERGEGIVFWRWLGRDGDDPERTRRVPLLRTFTVFNVAQCEDLSLADANPGVALDPIERAEEVITGYAGGPPILHDADRAYYIPSRDEAHLPPRDAFTSADGYYATVFHELSHSTGHTARLDRADFHTAAPFGSESYSREELVAEFSAAFLAYEAGIDPSRLEQSAAYVASWLRALNDDRRLVVVAAGQGQRAADHILGRVAVSEDDRD